MAHLLLTYCSNTGYLFCLLKKSLKKIIRCQYSYKIKPY